MVVSDRETLVGAVVAAAGALVLELDEPHASRTSTASTAAPRNAAGLLRPRGSKDSRQRMSRSIGGRTSPGYVVSNLLGVALTNNAR